MEARLKELGDLRSRGVISQHEYESARAAAIGLAPPGAIDTKPQAHCRFGHKMEWVKQYMVRGKHGPRTVQGAVCTVCTRKVKEGDYFFLCTTPEQCVSRRFVCHECGLSGAEARYPTQQRWNNRLFGCTDDTGVCLDSVFCYYCLVAQMLYASKEGLPTDGTAASFSCDCNRCCTASFMMILEVLYLGLIGAFASILLYDVAEKKYSIAKEDQISCCGSFMVGFFCRCCVAAEVSREHASHGAFMGGVACAKAPSSYIPRRPLPPMGETESSALIAYAAAHPPPPHPPPPPMTTGMSFPPSTDYTPSTDPTADPLPPPQQQQQGGFYGPSQNQPLTSYLY